MVVSEYMEVMIMFNQWINRLVKSKTRKRKLLRKPRIVWPALIQTAEGNVRKIGVKHKPFPETLHMNVELRPNMVTHQDVRAEVILDDQVCASASIYKDLSGDMLRIYGRCASVDFIIKGWEAVDDEARQIGMVKKNGDILYTKEFFTCTDSVVDEQTTLEHRIVNKHTNKKHIYPYGGYLGKDGAFGDALYMTLTSELNHTKINIHSYGDLLAKGISPFDAHEKYVFQDIDGSNRDKLISLEKIVEDRSIKCEFTLNIQENTWIQPYQVIRIARKDGMFEADLTLQKIGKPALRRLA